MQTVQNQFRRHRMLCLTRLYILCFHNVLLKVSFRRNVAFGYGVYPLMDTNVLNRRLTCIMKQTSLLNHISVGGRVCRGQIWSPNIWGPSLLGAEFVKGRDCQGPCLLGAEMSRNHFNPLILTDLFYLYIQNQLLAVAHEQSPHNCENTQF